MPLLEFMQPFDGRQSPLSPEEQERAANLFHATLGNLMLEHVPYVTRYLPLILGDRAPRLHLRPLDAESILQKAEIGLAYNEDQEVRAFTKLHFEPPNDIETEVTYQSPSSKSVTRTDVENFDRRLDLAEATVLGTNSQPVGEEEIANLSKLLDQMTPFAPN